MFLIPKIIIAIFIINNPTFTTKIRYDGYKVYGVAPTTEEQVYALTEKRQQTKSIIFLEEPSLSLDVVFIIVAPDKVDDFLLFLTRNSLSFELLENNAQSKLNEEFEINPRDSSYDWNKYHSLEETYYWIDQLAVKYPQVEVINAGQTYENRTIKGAKISYKPGNTRVFIEAGIHAREWIAPATATFIINQLLISEDPDVRNIAENFDWYIIPHANPDGYVYTKTDRLWRKTRSKRGNCYGVDANRNWDSHWNESNIDMDVCDYQVNPGPEPFSEIETKSLSEYIATVSENLKVYISFHAYSQLMMWPYGYTSKRTWNYDNLKNISDVALQALYKRYNTVYSSGSIYDVIKYNSSGSSLEWVYDNFDVPLAYAYELRPSRDRMSWSGFKLPAKDIIPTGLETLDSIEALLNQAKKLGYFNMVTD